MVTGSSFGSLYIRQPRGQLVHQGLTRVSSERAWQQGVVLAGRPPAAGLLLLNSACWQVVALPAALQRSAWSSTAAQL
jgi:hypothetical protein